MNERIKQIAEQAGYEKDMFGIGHWDMPECQKFAELIVKECAEMGDNFDGQPAGNTVRKYLTAGDAIREYFGVTE
jgi:hypothetical protein